MASAVVEAAAEASVAVPQDVTGFDPVTGVGARAEVDGRTVVVGQRSLLKREGLTVPDELTERDRDAQNAGRVLTLVGWDGTARGLLVAADVDEVVVLTGDTWQAAEPFAKRPVVDAVYAGMPPEAKTATVERLRERGTVAMIATGATMRRRLSLRTWGSRRPTGQSWWRTLQR